ncbi:MAG: IS30 family transposase [bacterium]
MKKATKLTVFDRGQIQGMLKKHASIGEIARKLGRSKSSISDEIKRHQEWNEATGSWIYCAASAQEAMVTVRTAGRYAGRQPLKTLQTYTYVVDHLRQGWSPEQIAGSLVHECSTNSNLRRISHEAIYTYIYSKEAKDLKLYEYLPWKRKRRQKKYGRAAGCARIPNRISIHDRPQEVESRVAFGHYEGDTIVGKQSEDPVIHTQVERMTRFLNAKIIPDKTAASTRNAQQEIFTDTPALSTTNDNGHEFAEHENLKKDTGVVSYFADPYSSWQRGTNEYHNGLVRRYLPKKTSFIGLTQDDLDDMVWEINNRPRKCLGFKTPQQLFDQMLQSHLSIPPIVRIQG